MKNPDMKQLALLSALIDSQSLTEAARRLDVTPSGASQALNRLRDIMGDPLCTREGHGWQLTPFGETAMPGIRSILDTWSQSQASPSNFNPARCDAELRIACHDGFGEAHLTDFCRALLAHAPQMSFDFLPAADAATDLRRLREGSIDLALSPSPPPPLARDMRTTQVAAWPLSHVCLMSEHPRIGRTISMAAYLAEEHLAVDTAAADPSGAALEPIDQQLTDSGLMPRRLMRLHNWQLCAQLLARSPRLVTVTAAQAAALCQSGGIRSVPLPIALQFPVMTLHMVWHERCATLPHHRWVRELLLETLCAERSDADLAEDATPRDATPAAASVVMLSARRS